MIDGISKGKINRPHLVLIYGPDGVGKSSFAASAPHPLFLGSEDGTSFLDVHRFSKVQSIDDINQALTDLATKPHDYKTLVIDSLDWLEPLVWKKVCKEGGKKSIEDFGYGRGYVEAIEEWRGIIQKLSVLRERGMNLVLIAHSQVKTFADPIKNASYDRFCLKLNDKASALFREYVDTVLFANFEVFVKGDLDKKVKAFGEGERYLYTERRPAWDAKNRQGLPLRIPLSWELYEEALKGSTMDYKTKALELLDLVTDEEIKGKALKSIQAASEQEQFKKIFDRLTIITKENI